LGKANVYSKNQKEGRDVLTRSDRVQKEGQVALRDQTERNPGKREKTGYPGEET